MDKLIIEDINTIVNNIKSTKLSSTNREMQAIVFFDLTGSTKLKLEKGHTLGTLASLRFSLACKKITDNFDGAVVKYLGDGVLCRFDDPVKACMAAINVKVMCKNLGLISSTGISMGLVGVYSDELGIEDVLGATVDRAARIQSLALPFQILVDNSVLDGVESHLKDYKDIVFSNYFEVTLKGIGPVRMSEISIKKLGLTNGMMFPFRIHEDGKLSVSDKVNFFKTAQNTFDIIGIGNTTFLKYLTGLKPSEFKDHIRNLLASSVTVNIYCLDPNFKSAIRELELHGETKYANELRLTIKDFCKVRELFNEEGLPGTFNVFTYKRHPLYHCFSIDNNDSVNGKFLVSNYLYGVSKPSSPVIEFSKRSNKTLFDAYTKSIEELKSESMEVI